MRLYQQSPHSLPQPQLDQFCEWLVSPNCELFCGLLRSKILEASAEVAQNTCEYAEDFMASQRPSEKAISLMCDISRWAVCLKVIEETQAEVEERLKEKLAPIEITKSINTEI